MQMEQCQRHSPASFKVLRTNFQFFLEVWQHSCSLTLSVSLTVFLFPIAKEGCFVHSLVIFVLKPRKIRFYHNLSHY